jgi:hypothetical protein
MLALCMSIMTRKFIGDFYKEQYDIVYKIYHECIEEIWGPAA